MKEKPILFSAPMVRAILDGTKTQTRRIVRPQPSDHFRPVMGRYHPLRIARDGEAFPAGECFGASDENEDCPCPYGEPGFRLWVRETFAVIEGSQIDFRAYRATAGPVAVAAVKKWKPSIFMSRADSRITLEITDIRVERLQDLTEEDAKNEGCSDVQMVEGVPMWTSAREAYSELWDSINGTGSWGLNPWVWVISFKRITP